MRWMFLVAALALAGPAAGQPVSTETPETAAQFGMDQAVERQRVQHALDRMRQLGRWHAGGIQVLLCARLDRLIERTPRP